MYIVMYKVVMYNTSLCRPDDALIVRNIYIQIFLFVFYCETYSKHIPRKVPPNISNFL